MTRTRIAVAGAGAIGKAHIAVLRRSATTTLSAIVDPAPAAQAMADAAGVPRFTSLAALIAHVRPEGIVLATPNPMHVSQALECIHAGLPVLLEKPIATTVAEATTLVHAVEACGARLLIGHHRAHSPIMARAREVIEAGTLGRLVAVTGSAMFFKPDHYFTDAPWRRQIGAGPILMNLIHEIHNLRMLCGEITAVQAFKSQAVRGFPVEDTVAINLRFASGVLGTFLLSDTTASARSWEQTSQEDKAFASDDDEDCYLIAGTRGSLAVPTMRLKTYANDADRSWWKPFERSTVPLVRADPLAAQMEHFGAVVRGEATPRVTARDGLANRRVTEAVVTAAESGSTIDLQHCNPRLDTP